MPYVVRVFVAFVMESQVRIPVAAMGCFVVLFLLRCFVVCFLSFRGVVVVSAVVLLLVAGSFARHVGGSSRD